jgi:hypothetical protein
MECFQPSEENSQHLGTYAMGNSPKVLADLFMNFCTVIIASVSSQYS